MFINLTIVTTWLLLNQKWVSQPAQLIHITIQKDTRIAMSLGQGPSLMGCSENSVEVQSHICFLKIMRWLS